MKTLLKLFGIAVLVAAIGFSMTSCAAAPTVRHVEAMELAAAGTTEIISVPWSHYTLLPSHDYVVVGAIVLRHPDRATVLVDLMDRAIAMGGHDLINVRLAVTEEGHINVATAVAIRYTDEMLRPLGQALNLSAPSFSLMGNAGAPLEIVRAPWAAHSNLFVSKGYVVVGGIGLRTTNRAMILADLMERAIAMGGHDIMNARLVIEDGEIIGATAVAIMYTEETIIHPVAPPPVTILPAMGIHAPDVPAAAAEEETSRRRWPIVLGVGGGAAGLLLLLAAMGGW